MEEGEAIENRMLTRVIEGAQKKVEARNFDIRKHLLEYDDVPNRQRKAFYERRRLVLEQGEVHDEIVEMVEGVLVALFEEYWPDKGQPDDAVMDALAGALEHQFGVPLSTREAPFRVGDAVNTDRDELGRALMDALVAQFKEKGRRCDELSEAHQDIGYPNFAWFERDILLRILDTQWKDHLHTMDGLREGISLRGYAQKDPKVEFQREGFRLYEEFEDRVDLQVSEVLFKFALPEPQAQVAPRPSPPPAPRGPGSAIERQSGAPGHPGGPGRSGRRSVYGRCEGRQGGPQRPVSVRQRQEVQEVSRRLRGPV